MTVTSKLPTKSSQKLKAAATLSACKIEVVLLIVVALLIGNVYVIYLARDYNDRACREAIMQAAWPLRVAKILRLL